MERYADVVLPLAQPAYTFAVPEGMELAYRLMTTLNKSARVRLSQSVPLV